ncbi:hypothetical protein TrRE_jg4299 [Triparma retinervis]|uniref:Uncharacterized protein n=1 Tax=Triparma retinervis TaxID=2557542 RepID=A0A9W7DK23_9STRA|nr:hypothetical protein TrRE_jg4299 [Triparma retinervis]
MIPLKKRTQLRVAQIVGNDNALKMISKERKWIVYLLGEVVESYIKSSKTKPTKISTPIDLIKNDEAKMIGSSFAWYLSMELSTYNIASNAVDTWIRSYPALISLDEQHPGFRCVMEAFGVEFFKRVNWGLKLRVLAGTVLSLGDLISDLTMVQIYAGRGETFQESFVLACVVSCLACQTFCAFINHPNIPPCERFAECLVAAIGCRPIVDAYRVSLGVAKRQGSLVTPFMDMAINRVIELCFESVPMTILQVYVLLNQLRQGKAVLLLEVLSLLSSATSTGFAASMLTYDFDVNRAARRESPEFYGMIQFRMRSKIIAFISMMFANTCTLLLRSITTALLLLVNVRTALFVLSADLGLLLVTKMYRGDFMYHTPIGSPAMKKPLAFCCRVLNKIVADFTGMVQLRHPQEMGGLYFTMNEIIGKVLCVVSTIMFMKQNDSVNLWPIVGTVFAVWVACYAVFLSSMKAKYLKSFFDTRTGIEFNNEKFHAMAGKVKGRKGWDAAVVRHLISTNPAMLVEVKEEVDFFVPAIVSCIPIEYLKKVKGVVPSRRKSSMIDAMRLSFLAASSLGVAGSEGLGLLNEALDAESELKNLATSVIRQSSRSSTLVSSSGSGSGSGS